jgi:hypothetical protein
VSCHRTVNSCFYQIYELFLVNYKSDFQFLQMRYLNNNFLLPRKGNWPAVLVVVAIPGSILGFIEDQAFSPSLDLASIFSV